MAGVMAHTPALSTKGPVYAHYTGYFYSRRLYVAYCFHHRGLVALSNLNLKFPNLQLGPGGLGLRPARTQADA